MLTKNVLCLLSCSVISNGSSEKENVGFWTMNHVVDPALRLLHSNIPPFPLRHQFSFWKEFHQLFRQHDMSKEKAQMK